MLRFLIAPFQRTPAAATVQASSNDRARQEFERLFRDDLAALTLTLRHRSPAERRPDPAHA